MPWDQAAVRLELVIPQALSQNVSLLPAYQAIQLPTWRDHLDLCGLLGFRNHSASLCSAASMSFHSKGLESRGQFGKHLFGLQFCRSSVSLPDPYPHLME